MARPITPWRSPPASTPSALPELCQTGIQSVKIEGANAAPPTWEQVTRVWRAAIDAYQANPDAYQVKGEWDAQLARVSEGSQTTLGATIASGNKEPCP